MGNNFRVGSIYTPGELAKTVKSYIDLERAKERLGGACPVLADIGRHRFVRGRPGRRPLQRKMSGWENK